MLRFGACYHPEQWSAAQAVDHVRLMVKARMNTVRIGESCWCRFEPEQGKYRFDWLDPVLDVLEKEGISTLLCTPTAVAPLWVHSRHPNVLRHDARGHRAAPGTIHACCINAPEFQMLSEALVQNLARHYAKRSGVVAWQIDNALGSGGSARCYCEHCEKAFRAWLLAKYQTTDAVNEAWVSAASGMEIRQWSEVTLPRGDRGKANPGHWQDYARFASDMLVGFHRRQAEAIRSASPESRITCSTVPRAGYLNLYQLAEHLDFVGRVSTPDRTDPYLASYGSAVARSLKGSFWVTEQTCGAMQERPGVVSESAEPAELRRWAWQAVANGATGVLFHPFRAALGGADNLRAGVLDWDGAPRRRYKEVARTGDEFGKVAAELEGTRIDSKVALLRSFDARWSAEAQPGAVGFHYDDHCFDLYRAVKRTGHTCAMIDGADEMRTYSAVLAPCLSIVDDATVARLEKYVRDGGTLILTAQSGTRELNNAMIGIPRPGQFAALIGATVEEVVVPPATVQQTINFARGALIAQTCGVRHWLEVLELMGAESLAEYLDGRLKGKPAIVRRSVGSGQVIYIGVYLPRTVLEAFIAEYLPDYPMKDIPEGVEVVQHKGEGHRIVFVLNHTAERKEVKLPGKFPDLITGETVGPSVTISANGILVLKA